MTLTSHFTVFLLFHNPQHSPSGSPHLYLTTRWSAYVLTIVGATRAPGHAVQLSNTHPLQRHKRIDFASFVASSSPLNAASMMFPPCPARLPCTSRSFINDCRVLGCRRAAIHESASSSLTFETSWSQLARCVPAPFESLPGKPTGFCLERLNTLPDKGVVWHQWNRNATVTVLSWRDSASVTARRWRL